MPKLNLEKEITSEVVRRAKCMYIEGHKDDCWHWLGGINSLGYGSIMVNRIRYSAHRITYLYYNNLTKLPLEILHKCDTPICVNPNHLFAGTQGDNMRDCLEKGRYNAPKGVKHYAATFNERDIINIRRKRTEGYTCAELGQQYNTSHQYISDICNRRTWKHI